MSGAGRTTPAKLAEAEVQRWLGIVEKEVAGLKLESKTKVSEDIARVWATNRQKIKKSEENQVVLPRPLETIPMKPLSYDPQSSSSGEEGERKKRKREYAKVFSERAK